MPLPGETALIAAGVLASQGRFHSIEVVIVVAALAAIIGDNVGYWLGRKGGRALLERTPFVRDAFERALPPAERFFERHGPKTVFLGRFVAFLRITSAWLAGISHMPWWRFFFWNAAGGIVWATLVGVVAYKFGEAAAEAINKYGLYGGDRRRRRARNRVRRVSDLEEANARKPGDADAGSIEPTRANASVDDLSTAVFPTSRSSVSVTHVISARSPFEGDDYLARRTVLVCDNCGNEVGENKGATLRVTFTDARRGSKVADSATTARRRCPAAPPLAAAAGRRRPPSPDAPRRPAALAATAPQAPASPIADAATGECRSSAVLRPRAGRSRPGQVYDGPMGSAQTIGLSLLAGPRTRARSRCCSSAIWRASTTSRF